MTNKQKLIKLYKECSKTGKLPHHGLCSCLDYLEINKTKLKLFQPNSVQMNQLQIKGKSCLFWASDMKFQCNGSHWYKFTPLRQTILAFLIAMED